MKIPNADHTSWPKNNIRFKWKW